MSRPQREFKEKLRALRGDRIRSFSSEQLAGVVVAFLQEVAQGRLRPATAADHSLKALLGYWLAPLWSGRDMLDGFSHENNMCFGVGSLDAPAELQERFADAVELLLRHHLIREMPGQDSGDLVELTPEGVSMRVFDNFELDIERTAREIHDLYRSSVFRVEVCTASADRRNGTCFLAEGQTLVTSAHVIDAGDWRVWVQDAELRHDMFLVCRHPERDLAVLSLRSSVYYKMLDGLRPLRIETRPDYTKPTEQVILFGFPAIPRRETQLITETRSYCGDTSYYDKRTDYVTFSGNTPGGYSGGPVVNLRGHLLGVAEEVTVTGNSTIEPNKLADFGHAAPAKYVLELIRRINSTRPVPLRFCPRCGSTALRWNTEQVVDVDSDGPHAYDRDVVACEACDWQTSGY